MSNLYLYKNNYIKELRAKSELNLDTKYLYIKLCLENDIKLDMNLSNIIEFIKKINYCNYVEIMDMLSKKKIYSSSLLKYIFNEHGDKEINQNNDLSRFVGNILMKLGNNQCFRYLKNAMKIGDTKSTIIYGKYLMDHYPLKSLQLFEKAQSLNNYNSLLYIGKCYHLLEDNVEAIKNYEQSIEKGHIKNIAELSELLINEGKTIEAKKYLVRGVLDLDKLSLKKYIKYTKNVDKIKLLLIMMDEKKIINKDIYLGYIYLYIFRNLTKSLDYFRTYKKITLEMDYYHKECLREIFKENMKNNKKFCDIKFSFCY